MLTVQCDAKEWASRQCSETTPTTEVKNWYEISSGEKILDPDDRKIHTIVILELTNDSVLDSTAKHACGPEHARKVVQSMAEEIIRLNETAAAPSSL